MASGCALCKGAGYVLERLADRSVARVCACSDSCEACHGEGRIYEERDGYSWARPCACRTVARRAALFNAAGLPARCAHSFEEYDPQNEEQTRALTAAMGTARLYRSDKPSKGFVVAGPVGTGKTHLLCATLKHLTLELGVPARYVEISLLFADIRRAFSENRSAVEAVQPLVDSEVLAVDELGKGRGTAFELDTLDELVARRYNAGRTTLFATNFLLAEERARASGPVDGYMGPQQMLQEQGDTLLRNRVGERIWSRLHEMCHLIQLPATTLDWRRRLAMAR